MVLQFSFCLLFFSSRWLFYPCVTNICNASVNSTCALPPPAPGLLRALCPPCQYRGWGICKFYTARGVGHLLTPGQFASFSHPRGFLSEYTTQRVLLEKTQIEIGSSVKERNKLKRVVKACSRFYSCISSLLIKIT